MNYILNRSFSRIKRHKILSIVEFFCLFLGVFIAMLFLSIVNNNIEDQRTLKEVAIDDIYSVNLTSMDGFKLNKEEIEEIENNDSLELVGYVEKIEKESILINGINVASGNINEVNKGLINIYKNFISSGEWLKTSEDVVVGKNIQILYGLNLNDKIILNGKSFGVIGITENPEYKRDFIILNNDYLVNPTLFIKCTNGDMTICLNNEPIIPIHYKLSSISNTVSRNWVLGISLLMTTALLILLFSFVNINNVTNFILEQEKKKYSVYMSIGAKYSQIFKMEFYRLILLNLSSIVLSVILVYIIQKKYLTLKYFNLNINLSGWIILFTIFTSTLFLLMLTNKNLKLLKGNIIRENDVL